MARIPISQIPNAPQIAQGPVLTNPNAIRVPDIERSARSLIQPTMAQGSLDGAAKGWQSFAAGVGSFGASMEKVPAKVRAVLADWQQRKTAANDGGSKAAIDGIVTQRMAEHNERKKELPRGQRQPALKKALLGLRTDIDAVPLSDGAREQIRANHARWELRTLAQGQIEDTQEELAQNKADIAAAFRRSIVAGEFEKAYDFLDEGRRVDLFNDNEYRGLDEEAREIGRESHLAKIIELNPQRAYEDIREYVDTGHHESLGESFRNQQEARSYAVLAKTAWDDQRVATRQTLREGIRSRRFKDEDDLRRAASEAGYSDEAALGSLATSFHRDIPRNPETLTKLRTRLASVDLSQDDAIERYESLSSAIESTVPPTLQAPLLSTLQASWTAAREGKAMPPQRRISAALEGEIDQLADLSFLGDTGAVGGEIVEAERHADVWNRAQAAKDFMGGWWKQHADADPAQARQALASYLQDDIVAAASRSMSEGPGRA